MPDWNLLRQQSIRPGGFGADRSSIWPEVLDAQIPIKLETSDENDTPTTHRDERQIMLDTDRSFVLYPVVDGKNKDDLKAQLNELIVSIFRRRPRLNYYQGYHDIISVLFLTLPQELQLHCAEKMSLYRLRDSMGTGLEPVLGQTRVLKKLIGLADPSYAAVLDRNLPLPYYALSNLLTLFAHDVPDLSIIQHVFDYLLVRPPIVAVYLAAAIVLTRKDEVYRLEEAGEEGMLHPLLTSLPGIYEESSQFIEDDHKTLLKTDEAEKTLMSEILEDLEPFNEKPLSPVKEDVILPPPHILTYKSLSSPIEDDSPKLGPSSIGPQDDIEDATHISDADTVVEGQLSPTDEKPSPVPESPLYVESTLGDTSFFSPASNDETLVSDTPVVKLEEVKQEYEQSVSSFDEPEQHRPRVSLTTLLIQADELYSRFPPSQPELCLSSILGPNSTIFTWSESPPGGSLSESEAEAIVEKPETVVLQYVDPEDQPPEKPEKAVVRRRKLRKGLFGRSRLEKRTMLAGAVLVLGIAMAYGMRPASGDRDFRRLGRWLVEFHLRRLFGWII